MTSTGLSEGIWWKIEFSLTLLLIISFMILQREYFWRFQFSINKWITRNNWNKLEFRIFLVLPFACRFLDCSDCCYCHPAAAGSAQVSRSAASTYSASRLVLNSKAEQSRLGTTKASNLPSNSARFSSNAAFLEDASSLLAAQVFLQDPQIIQIHFC